MTRTPTVALVLRLPPALHERARRRAFRDRSSLNQLLVAALTQYLAAPRKGAAR